MKKTLFLLLSFFSVAALAQTCEQVDNELYKGLREMDRFSQFGEEPDEDKLAASTQKFMSELKNYLLETDSLSCDFNRSAPDELLVISSADKKVLAFSWDNQTGGTMRDYDAIIQFIDKSGKLSLKELDGIDYIENIFTTELNNQTYYWLISYSISDSQTRGSGATLYQINERGFVPVDLIKTKKLTSQIGFSYSLLDGEHVHSNRYFRYDNQTKTLSFPVVIATDENLIGKVTDKRIEYRFDGQYFVRVKN